MLLIIMEKVVTIKITKQPGPKISKVGDMMYYV
jgi:hypothetical protein